jgi:Putative porin
MTIAKQYYNRLITSAAALLVLGALNGLCAAASDPMSELLNMMTQKGMLTEAEAEKVKSAAAALKAEAEANEAKSMAAATSKWKIDKAIKSVELFGDIRLRYENRQVDTPANENLELGRFRYALRLGLRGDALDNFYYGVRLETAANPRSPWVTFGTSSSGAPYYGPFGKSTAGISLGQVYLGWRPASWVDVTVGKMPNPLYTTPMLWDTDLNPEGAAERFKYSVGKADLFANFGQFLYQDVNPTHTGPFLVPSIPLGQDASVPFLLAWQAGLVFHFKDDMSLKVAPTLYNYMGRGQNSAPGGTPAVPGFSDYFVGEGAGVPVNGVSGYNTGPNDGFAFNQTAVNDLLVLDIPFEFNFKLAKLQARIFGDFAENLDGAQRAAAAVAAGRTNNISISLSLPYQPNDNKAYQIGFGIGNGDNLGLVYGSPVRKRTWEARVYWQHVEQYALDPNLLDSDFFEGRGNMEGIYSAFAYSFSDNVIGTIRYGYGTRINNKLGTGGSNLDIPQVNPIQDYHILQLDLTWRF